MVCAMHYKPCQPNSQAPAQLSEKQGVKIESKPITAIENLYQYDKSCTLRLNM